MTKDEIEKAASEYAEKVYGVDCVPISWRQEDGFALLAKARQQIKEAVLFGAEHALPRWVSVEDRLPSSDAECLLYVRHERYYWEDVVIERDRKESVRKLSIWHEKRVAICEEPQHWKKEGVTHWHPLPPPPEGEK